MKDMDREEPTTIDENAANPNSDEPRVVRTYNIPLTLSTPFYGFLTASKLNVACKRALIGLVKHITASILRQIQQPINQACREKGQILQDARKIHRGQKPPRSITHYRALFHDSSKRGEISTYLVKNTLRGQFRHLDRKFPRFREVLAGASLADIAPFLTSNYVVQNLRRSLSGLFRWNLSHIRPQLRGMRRLMERAPNFDPGLRLTSKNAEFVQLRTGVEALLHLAPCPQGLQLDLLEKILNKFQQGHVLHVLLLSREQVHGLTPKLVNLKGTTYSTRVIAQQLELFRQFCETHRTALEELVQQSLSGLVRITPNEGLVAVRTAIQEHDQYIAFLEAKQYGIYHATRKKKALAALYANTNWCHYLACGVLPSERYLKALAKLVGASPKIRVKSESALYSVVPVAFLTKLAKRRGCGSHALLEQFFEIFTAENCTNGPFTSPQNRKQFSPIDLTPLNNEFLVIRPGKTANDLLTKFLRVGQAIPLRIVPSEVLTFYTGSATGKLTETQLKQFDQDLLTRKNYKDADIATILQLISFNGIKALSTKTIRAKSMRISELARSLVNPILEINVFTNKRLKWGLYKVKAIISNPEVELAPIRILPVTDLNNSCTCQLIFTSKKVQPEFKSQVRCMKEIQIGNLRTGELVGIDVNQEDEHKIYIAPDWDSSAQYIQTAKLEQKLKRPIYNEAQDRQFTAYVHNGSRSERVSETINTLSGDLKANLSHLKKVKKMKKKVQGAYGKTKLHTITAAGAFYTRLVQVAAAKGLQPEAEELQETLTAIRKIPKQRFHELAQLRNQRTALIQKILTTLEKSGCPEGESARLQFRQLRDRGKKMHRQETELNYLQRKINHLRNEVDQKLSRLVGMILCEIHPGKLVYEALHVKHQGMKGVLGEITQYMPDMAEFIAKAVEIVDLYGQAQGILLQTKVYGVHPGGTSSPPHLPTGLTFDRGGKNGWHEVTIPATAQDGTSYPSLKINSHILACQKLCEKVRSL